MELWPAVIIIFCAFGGFVLAAYLSHKKSRAEPMVCPLKGDCAAVIRSDFSNFFGIGVEKIGIAYYLAIAAVYGILLVWPILVTPVTSFILVGFSSAAFLFSAYLTFIQLGFLKEICTWCLLSALLSTIIFFASVAVSDFSFVPLLSAWQPLILVFHFVGLALGVGGATFSDVFFFKFLRDLKISAEEADVLQTISQISWFGLGLLVISEAGLYLANPALLSTSSQFATKAIILGIIIVNGAFLNLKAAPRLVQISFGDDPHKNPQEELHRERKLGFGLSAVSIVSWYCILILSAIPRLPFSLLAALAIYLGLLMIAVALSQTLERHFGKQIMPS